MLGDRDGDGVSEYLVGDRVSRGPSAPGTWFELRDGRTGRRVWSAERKQPFEGGSACAVRDLDGGGVADFVAWRRVLPWSELGATPTDQPYELTAYSTESLRPLFRVRVDEYQALVSVLRDTNRSSVLEPSDEPMTRSVGDLDGDGDEDRLLGDAHGSLGAMVTLVSPGTGRTLWSVGVPRYGDTYCRLAYLDAFLVGDVDRDGRGDVVVMANHESEPPLPCVLACFSARDGSVLWSRTIARRGYVEAAAWDDLDCDGVRELLVSRFELDSSKPGQLFVVDGASGRMLRAIE